MSISERINPDNLNIHQFQETPEGRPELPFDVERDISPKIKHTFKTKLAETNNKLEYYTLARDIKLLWPNEPVDSQLFSDESLLGELEQLLTRKDNIRLLYFAANVLSIRPGISIDTDTLQRFWQATIPIIEWRRKNGEYLHLTSLISFAKRFDPEHEFDLTKEELAKMKDALEECRTDSLMSLYADYAGKLKLIDPGFKPELTQEEWIKLHKLLTDEPKLHLAASMKILAAHKVEVTAAGVIDIQMYPLEDIKQSTPQIPEIRKF
jgi:hypothetical protein